MSRPEEFPPLRREFVDGLSQWTAPYFAISAACWVGQYAMRVWLDPSKLAAYQLMPSDVVNAITAQKR